MTRLRVAGPAGSTAPRGPTSALETPTPVADTTTCARGADITASASQGQQSPRQPDVATGRVPPDRAAPARTRSQPRIDFATGRVLPDRAAPARTRPQPRIDFATGRVLPDRPAPARTRPQPRIDFATGRVLPDRPAPARTRPQPRIDFATGRVLPDRPAPVSDGTAVQFQAASGHAADLTASEVHAAAAAGIRDRGELLPHRERIQRAFGPDHDLSQVTAHVGGPATAAAAQLRANAYTAGEHIAFASAPDLRLAAHEAAHVVQQRAGVALSAGVGRSGDSYEQNAEAVAERVAAGRLAADLLPLVAATRGQAPAVQRDERRDAPPPAHADASNGTDVDIAWVGTLDPKLVDEIDVYYSDAKARNASAAATRDQLRAVKATSPADAAWQKHQIAIAGERRKADAAADLDQTVTSHHRAETAVDPSGPVITRGEGQRIARTNFVKWTTSLLGSVDKAKAHYRSIKPVPGLSILLTDKAGERLLAAKKEFEAEHPGFTFVPGGGFSMRDLHEARNGVGMLGHALGVAIDIHATQNPNIKLPKETGLGNYEYLIAHAGADASGRPGRAKMSLDDAGFGSADRTIEALGKATIAGRDTRHDPIVEKIRTQFAEMVATSERLRQSMADSLPELRETRTRYFQWLNDKAALAVHEKRKDLSRDALTKARDLLNAHEMAFREKLERAIKPWLELIEGHAALDRAGLAFEDFLLAPHDLKLKEIDAIDAKAPDALTKLNALDARWQLSGGAPKPTHPAALKVFLLKRAREQRAAIPSGPKATGSREYLTAELGVLTRWKKLLSDPALVFGAPDRQIDAQEIPVMQLIEYGFIESSPMMGPIQQNKRDKKEEVFNADVAAALARHGFAPGATFGDTMHFDFIEGYSQAVPGGRSSNNMNPDRFGPLGLHGSPDPAKDKP